MMNDLLDLGRTLSVHARLSRDGWARVISIDR
jgi:hypothetical protein